MMHQKNRNSRDDKSKNHGKNGDKNNAKFRGKSSDEASKFSPSEKRFKKDNEKSFDKKDSKFGDRNFSKKSDRDFSKDGDKRNSKFGEKSFSRKSDKDFSKSYDKKDSKFGEKSFSKRSSSARDWEKDKKDAPKGKFFDRKRDSSENFRERDEYQEKTYKKRGRKEKSSTTANDDGLIRLNRYISNAGICSRRKADELIEAGVVSVNGEVISELGFKVDPAKDQVRYNGELLKREKKVYVLLNKPKDYITTTDDPQERRTVMQLVAKASKERIYPVGRLDRNTTGLLLMTNDGDLADKLSHPKHKITKIYQVELNRNLTQGDLNKIAFGLELEDGLIKPDSVSYVTGGSKKEIGIQIHSGKNRIVRRIFEHLGYDVVKLDRVVYANLTKKDLPRGKWRFLQEHELIQLKHLL